MESDTENMQIIYSNGRFEARFSQDFQGDLDAVKAAGFKADTSSGAWVWHTAKIPVLEKLREKRPASGISIDNDTFAKYKELSEQFRVNDEIKQAAKKLDKDRKKIEKHQAQEQATADVFGDKMYITKEDLPPMPPSINPFVRPEPPKELCFICQDPLYFYELPDICLWCEKTA